MTQTDTNTNPEQKSYTEELQVMGEQLLTRVKELLHEGNVRRIIIKQEGRTIMEFPLTIGVVGVVAAPVGQQHRALEDWRQVGGADV